MTGEIPNKPLHDDDGEQIGRGFTLDFEPLDAWYNYYPEDDETIIIAEAEDHYSVLKAKGEAEKMNLDGEEAGPIISRGTNLIVLGVE